MTRKPRDKPAKDDAKQPRIISDNGNLFIVMHGNRSIALGLIARGGKRAGKLGYFFRIGLYDEAKERDNLSLDLNQAIWIAKFGDLHILRGKWPLVGKLNGFSREAWPMPVFARHHEGFNINYICTYDENDVSLGLHTWRADQVPAHVKTSVVAEDGMAGAGFVEDYLMKILGLRIQ
jgi:Immunity protein 26